MDLISNAAEIGCLDSLVLKKRENLLELPSVHTRSAMASRAAMTVYGISTRLVEKVFVGYLKSWTKEALKERLKRHYTLATTLYNGKNKHSNRDRESFFLTNIVDFLNNNKGKFHHRYGNRRLYVDDLNNSLAFVKKLAAMRTTLENNDLDDNFIRQWLLKPDIPRFKLEYNYQQRTRSVRICLKQLHGSTYEGQIVLQIHQEGGKRDIVTQNISADVDSSWKVQITKQKTNTKSKRIIDGGIRGYLKFIEFDPRMQLIHTMVGLKSSAGDSRSQQFDHPRSAVFTEILLDLSKSANPATKIDAINKLKYLPDTIKVCTTENDILPCKSLVQTLNPMRPYDMAIRCHAIEAISQWQNCHAPLSYIVTNCNKNIMNNGNNASEKTLTSYIDAGTDLDPCGGWTPKTLWLPSSPYILPERNISSISSSSKMKIRKGTNKTGVVDTNGQNRSVADNVNSIDNGKKGDPWYGLHALLTTLKAYFYNDTGDVAIPSYMHPPQFYVFRIKIVEAISSIRDQNGLPPSTIRKVMGDLLKSALDSKDSRANSLYVAALLRAIGRTSRRKEDVNETISIYNQFMHFQNILPAPRNAILVSCLRGIADLESSFSKVDKKFEFHLLASGNVSTHVRIAAIESILRIYLAAGQGDGLRTIEWLVSRMLKDDSSFERSGAVRSVAISMLGRVVQDGMADESLKLQLLPSSSSCTNYSGINSIETKDSGVNICVDVANAAKSTDSYKSFVAKIWYALNHSSWYDWNLRQGLFKLYKSFFAYEIPEPFESIVEDRDNFLFAWPLSVPSSDVKDDGGSNKRQRTCLVNRIKPQNKQYGMEYDTPLLSPRRSTSGSVDGSLNGDMFSLDGGVISDRATNSNSDNACNNTNTPRSLMMNKPSIKAPEEPQDNLVFSNMTFVSGAKTGKERRKSTKLKIFKRKKR